MMGWDAKLVSQGGLPACAVVWLEWRGLSVKNTGGRRARRKSKGRGNGCKWAAWL